MVKRVLRALGQKHVANKLGVPIISLLCCSVNQMMRFVMFRCNHRHIVFASRQMLGHQMGLEVGRWIIIGPKACALGYGISYCKPYM